MSRPVKGIAIVVFIAVILVLALPLSNLAAGLPKNNSIAKMASDDQAFVAARDIISQKCVNCHTAEYVMPMYAFLPGARGLIENDIKLGTEFLNFQEALQPAKGRAVSEVVLAKVEHTLATGSMPPARYRALHWNGGLTEEEKVDLTNWIRDVRKAHYGSGTAAAEFAAEVIQPVPDSVEADAAKVALGDRLFHDTRLSKDNSISCASCHALDRGGTDRRQYSIGVGNAEGGINSPTVYNSGLHFVQFWDGRAADLEEQADGPVNNPIEMASNWDEVCAKLNEDREFSQAFNAVYPEGPSKETMIDAIATFENTLLTPNCRLDRYLKGDTEALSVQEQEGYRLFKGIGCATCHVGKDMGGQSYEKLGRKKDYFAGRDLTDADNGRFNVTKNEADRHTFKTPTLRNIAQTAPYLHNGEMTDLAEVVKLMAEYQMGRAVTSREVAAITAFLNTLTGEYKGQVIQ